MWFRRMVFTGVADIKSVSVEKGQTIIFSCFTTNIRMATFEQDLADDMNNFMIPHDDGDKGLTPFRFVTDETAVLYFRPDQNTAATLTVMVLN